MKKILLILGALFLVLNPAFAVPGYLTVPVEVTPTTTSGADMNMSMMAIYAAYNLVAGAVQEVTDYFDLKPAVYVYENPDNPATAIVEIYGQEGSTFTYTTNGAKANIDSIPYTGRLVLPLDTTINVCAESANGRTANSKFTISRAAAPLPEEVDYNTGTAIKFDTNGDIRFFIVYHDEPVELSTFILSAEDSAYLKDNFYWDEYTGPIYFKDIENLYFTIFWFYFPEEVGQSELPSFVYGKSYHTYPGSVYQYVFYDKGYYSDGWRYLEACPFEIKKTKWGASNIFTGLTSNSFGSGLKNTRSLYEYLGEVDYYSQTSGYSAKLAKNAYFGGKADWYIPSVEEMKLLSSTYKNLFSWFTDYWTSTEKNETEAYTYKGSAKKTKELKLLLIRQF